MISPTIRRLAAHVGAAIDDTPDDGVPPYDGLAIRTATATRTTSVAHEIAHFLRADPERRQLPNYGLGQAYAGRPTHATVATGEGLSEEHDASLLGILIEEALGEPFEDALLDHGWIRRKDDPFWPEIDAAGTMARLETRGLVRNGRPTCLDGFDV